MEEDDAEDDEDEEDDEEEVGPVDQNFRIKMMKILQNQNAMVGFQASP